MTESPQDSKYQTGSPADASELPEGTIISSDTLREQRIPPGQSRTRKWPVLQAGAVVDISPQQWSLKISGLVDNPITLNWGQFCELRRVKVFSDFHCVTQWSRLANIWEGVSTKTIAELVGVRPEAKFVLPGAYDENWSTNLAVKDFLADDALLCDTHDGELLNADHGGPVRLVVPLLYAWKSAKWLNSLQFVANDKPGFWEREGYHNHGDPWLEQRFNDPGSVPPGYDR